MDFFQPNDKREILRSVLVAQTEMPISNFWWKRCCNFAKICYELTSVLLQPSSTQPFWIHAKYNNEWKDTRHDQRSLTILKTFHCCCQKDLTISIRNWAKVSLVPTWCNKILNFIPIYAFKRDQIHSLQVYNKGNSSINRKRSSPLTHQIKWLKVYSNR